MDALIRKVDAEALLKQGEYVTAYLHARDRFIKTALRDTSRSKPFIARVAVWGLFQDKCSIPLRFKRFVVFPVMSVSMYEKFVAFHLTAEGNVVWLSTGFFTFWVHDVEPEQQTIEELQERTEQLRSATSALPRPSLWQNVRRIWSSL